MKERWIFEELCRDWLKLNTACFEWKDKRKRMAEKFWIPYFGRKDIREIKSIHISRFHSHLLDQGIHQGKIKSILAELKTLFRFYKKSLSEIPDFPKVQVQQAPIRWLNEDEQSSVLEFIPRVDLPIFTFMQHYGTRVNEALGLLRENLFLQHKQPYLVISTVLDWKKNLKPYTKTNRIKVLPIIPELEWIFEGKGRFVFEKYGRPYSHKMLRRLWHIASKKAGVPRIPLYNGMRHSFGCQRLNQGFSLDQVQTVMGHTTSTMTKRYAQYSVSKLMEIIRGRNESLLIIPNE